MSTKNRVFKKLAEESKTELSAQKVELSVQKLELGLVQDILKDIERGLSRGKEMKRFVDEVKSKNKELDKLTTKYNSTIKEHSKSIDGFNTTRHDLSANWNRAAGKYVKIVNNASDLGIDVPQKVEQGFKELDKMFNFQKNAYPKADALKRNLI